MKISKAIKRIAIGVAGSLLVGSLLADEGAGHLLLTADPAFEEIDGMRYVIIPGGETITFQATPEKPLSSLKLIFETGLGEEEKDGNGPHDISYTDEAGFGKILAIKFTSERTDENNVLCKTTEKETGRVIVPTIGPAGDQQGAGGMVDSVNGENGDLHFVSPKGEGNVKVEAKFGGAFSFDSRLAWTLPEGVTQVEGKPEQVAVPRTTPGKYEIVLKKKGTETVLAKMYVWIVWSTIASGNIGINSGGIAGGNFAISGGYTFQHTIQPATIITDTERPDLGGANTANPPGGQNSCGQDLINGVEKKWDSSRQIRGKFFKPAGYPTPCENDLDLNYPASDLTGNDDASTNDETSNNPYGSNGKLTAQDTIQRIYADNFGANGDTVELRLHFREFTRLEIDGVWYKISDFFLWRIHLKFRKLNNVWFDNGTNKATDNANW